MKLFWKTPEVVQGKKEANFQEETDDLLADVLQRQQAGMSPVLRLSEFEL